MKVLKVDDMKEDLANSSADQKNILRYRTLCNNLPQPVLAVSKEGIVQCCNRKAELVTGATSEELIGKHFLEVGIFVRERSDDYLALSEALKEGRVVRPFETLAEYSDGTREWVEVTMADVSTEGDSDEMLIIFKSIDAQKMKERELLLTQRRFSTLINNIPGMVYSCDFDQHWTMRFVSSGSLPLTGYSPEDLIENKVLAFNDIIHPDYREFLFEEWARNIKQKKPTQVEYIIITKDGTRKWVWEQGTAVYDDDGNVTALEGVIMDLSVRRKLEEERVGSELLFKAVFDKSPIAMALSKTNGDISALNRKFVETFGYDTNELKHLNDWWPLAYPDPEFREYVKSLWYAELNDEDYNGPNIVKVTNKAGEEISVEFLISLVGDDTLVIFNDVTEKERSIERINQAMLKAEESDRLKSAFLANMSHEIRTPMNGILGFLDLLNSEDLDSESRTRFMDIVNNSAHNLLNIINSIIDISKIEAGVEKIYKEQLVLNALILEATSLMHLMAETKEISIVCELTNTNGVVVESDSSKLRQIIINLISNAIKFTQEGGVTIRTDKTATHFQIMVIDTGIGIDPALHSTVFDRFRQVEMTNTRSYGGTGLGLAICKSYCEMLKGTISLQSSPGEGTTFTVTIPLKVPKSE